MKIMNDFDKKNRSVVMDLLTHRFGIPEFDAKDILQDAWLLLMEKLTLGTLPDVPERLLPYMLSVCDKKAHEYLRKRVYEYDETSLDDDTLTAERLDSIQEEVQSWTDFIEEQEKARERMLDAVEMELLKLNARQRALLQGYYFENKSMKELAKQLGYKSEDVAKNTKKRILNLIRSTVKQQERADSSRLSPAALLNSAAGYGKIKSIGLDVMTMLTQTNQHFYETRRKKIKSISRQIRRNLTIEGLSYTSSDTGERIAIST